MLNGDNLALEQSPCEDLPAARRSIPRIPIKAAAGTGMACKKQGVALSTFAEDVY